MEDLTATQQANMAISNMLPHATFPKLWYDPTDFFNEMGYTVLLHGSDNGKDYIKEFLEREGREGLPQNLKNLNIVFKGNIGNPDFVGIFFQTDVLKNNVLFIYEMYTSVECRNRGLAGHFIRHTQEYLQQLEVLFHTGNFIIAGLYEPEEQRQFFENNGFSSHVYEELDKLEWKDREIQIKKIEKSKIKTKDTNKKLQGGFRLVDSDYEEEEEKRPQQKTKAISKCGALNKHCQVQGCKTKKAVKGNNWPRHIKQHVLSGMYATAVSFEVCKGENCELCPEKGESKHGKHKILVCSKCHKEKTSPCFEIKDDQPVCKKCFK